MDNTWILLAINIVISIIGYLLIRSINRIDSDLKDHKQDALENKKVLADHSAQLYNLVHVPERVANHDVRISLIENSNEGFKLYLDEKFSNIEKTLARIEKRIDDNENK